MTREERACRDFLKLIIRRFPHVFHAGAYVGHAMLGIRAVDPDWRRLGRQIRFESEGVLFVARYVHRLPNGGGPLHGVEIAAINSRRQTLRVVTHITCIEDAAIWQATAPHLIAKAVAKVTAQAA
jgi:hypothetical protein